MMAAERLARDDAPTAEHREIGGWIGAPGECGVYCACGVTYGGFDTLAEASALLALHIALELQAAARGDGAMKAADDLTWREVLTALAYGLLARVVGDRQALAVHAYLHDRKGCDR